MEFQYDIFLSYRHRPLDSIITQKTFNLVESYRLPAPLRSQGHDIRRAFRDTEELAVSRILTDTIDRALHSTNCLLLVCSTDTPSSEWVDREVAMFIELGRADHIYPLLISGDPETSFPPSLKKIPDIMERVMDVRCPDNDPKKIVAKEKTALLKILADATGVGYRELQREHGLRNLRRFAAKSVAAVAVFLAVGAVSLGLMNLAQTYRDRAQAAEKASMSILQELTYGLPDKLTAVPGAYSKISDILRDNAAQINQILLLSTDKTSAGFEVAANYEKLATAMTVLGDYTNAEEQQLHAISLYENLVQDSDPAPLASAKNNLGKILTAAGRYTEAASVFDEAIAIQRQLDDPVTLAAILGNAGANGMQSGDTARAAALLSECISLLPQDASGDPQTLSVLAGASGNYGTLLYRQGDYPGAETQLTLSVTNYEALCSQVNSPQNRSAFVQNVSTLAACYSDEGRWEDAVTAYTNAIALAEELAADRENTDAVAALAVLYNNCGLCRNMQGDFAAADGWYRKARDLYKDLADSSGSAADIAVYATTSLNLGENAFKAGDYAASCDAFEEGLAAYATVAEELGSYHSAQYHTWRSYYDLIHLYDTQAAFNDALTAYVLQPDNVLVNMNLGYACLYAGYYEDCDRLLSTVAALGEGQAETIRLDIAAQKRSGLKSDHTEALLAMIGK